MSEEKRDGAIIVKGKAEDINSMMLETIRQTFNIYAEKVNSDPRAIISMEQYCKDVHFLIYIINDLCHRINEHKSGYIHRSKVLEMVEICKKCYGDFEFADCNCNCGIVLKIRRENEIQKETSSD